MELKSLENLFTQYGLLAFVPVVVGGLGLGLFFGWLVKRKVWKKVTPYLLRSYFALWFLLVLYYLLPQEIWFIALLVGIYWVFEPPKFEFKKEPPIEVQIQNLENKIKRILAKDKLTERDRLKLIEYQVKLTNLKEKVGYEKGYDEGYWKGYRRGRRGSWC